MAGVASHPELLPYQDAVLVAESVEKVALGDAAAPEAQHVDAGLRGVGQFGAHAGVVGALHGLRYPVAAADEDTLSVYYEYF